VRDVNFLVTDIDEAGTIGQANWRLDQVIVTGTNDIGQSVFPNVTAVTNMNNTFTITGSGTVAQAFSGSTSSFNNVLGSVNVNFSDDLERIIVEYNELSGAVDPQPRGIAALGGFTFCLPPYLRKTQLSPPPPEPVAPGNTISFGILITNQTGITMTNIGLADTFDAALLTFSNAVPPPTAVGAGTLSWLNVGPVAPGASTTVVVNFTANNVLVCQNSTNRAVATPTNPFLILTSAAPYAV
ncbi:MAG: hypothetical protein AAF492_08295, partial [Verrucomicrobiota bacterium]